ncbi:MAG TPA: TonB family protein [Thermoanaerobaculia bacterium]
MSADVDRILAQRGRRAGHGAEAASIAGAVALHLLLVALALFLPRLQPPPKPLDFVPVTVIPAQALGVHRPAPPRRAAPGPPAAEEEAAPKPPAPAPTPAPKPREEEPPKPLPKPAEKAPVLPEKADKKPDTKKTAEPVKPPVPTAATAPPSKTPPAAGRDASRGGNPNSPPNATAVGETGDQAGRRGGADGSPLGTTAFGSHIAGVDNPDFTYGYYLDRLLSLIDANWTRPSLGSGVYAIITFHIQRDGSLADLRVGQSSGYNSFDLAALRAVQNAAPFPPLPRAYNHDDLGIHLIVK